MVTPEQLARWEIFQTAPDEILREIQAKAEIAPYAPGEVIVSAGQPFTFFGLLLAGEAGAYIGEEQGEARRIETIERGRFFGEISLLTGQDTPMNLVTTAPSHILLIPIDLFNK